MLPFHLREGDDDCDGDDCGGGGDGGDGDDGGDDDDVDDDDINQPQQCECGDFIEIVDSPSPNKLVFWFVGPIAFVNRRLCDSKSSSPTTHSQVETLSIVSQSSGSIAPSIKVHFGGDFQLSFGFTGGYYGPLLET